MAGAGSRNCQCALLFPKYLFIGRDVHVAIQGHALDHSHPGLLVSALGLLKHPICSKLLELVTVPDFIVLR